MKTLLCDSIEKLLSEEMFDVYAPCMYKPCLEKYRDIIRLFAEDPNIKIYVCVPDAKTVGMLVLDKSLEMPEIKGIAVSEKYRGKGIGRKMISDVMDSEKLTVITAQTDDDAVGFYRKCGFKVIKNTVHYHDGVSVRYDCTLEMSDLASANQNREKV